MAQLMRDFLQYVRRNPVLWILPLFVFLAAAGFAMYIITRPVLGTAVYQP